MEPPGEVDKPEEGTKGLGLDGQLHDLIAVGEIESALSTSISSNSGDKSLGIRLPLLLRWLTAAQPLATASPSPTLDDSTSTVLVASPNAVVPLLEDAAAAHHDAENIEVLASSLAPAICKEVIGKLPPISRKKPDNEFISRQSGDVWDTKNIDKAIHRLLKQEQKRKRESNQTSMSNNKKQKLSSNDEYLEKMKTVIEVLEKDLENEDDEDIGIEKDVAMERESLQNGGDDTISSFVGASDDSYVSSIRRVLHELLLLVQNSLTTDKDGGMTSNTDDRDSTLHDTQKSPWVSIKPDYLLAQTDTTTSSSGIGGFGLPVMISALMHHAPILRYRHVSSALCRASIPQSSTLILHMAANCPAASSCLLRGCVDAYEDARKYQFLVKQSQLAEEMEMGEKAINIIHSSVASVKALASLSRREACNVVRVLRECDNSVMPSLVLKILLDTDEDEAASFVIEKLSSSSIKPPKISQTIDSGVSSKKRSLPLNQRIIRSKQIHNESKTNRGKAPEQNSSPIEDLLEDPAITEAALRCFSRTIIQLSRTAEEQFCTGKTSLYTKAYGLLTYFITIISQSSSNYGTIDTISAIHSLSKFVTNRSPDTGPDEESVMDEIYSLLLCTVLFTIAHVSTSNTTTQTAEKDCLACLESLLLHPVSMKTTIFASQMCRYLIDNNTNELLKLSLQSISGKYVSWDGEINKDLDICQWISSKIGSELLELVHDKATSIEYVLYDASIFIVKMKQSELEQSSELEQMIRTILDDPGRCCKLIKQSTVCDLISQSAKFTCRKRAPHIPIVLPLALERCSRKIWADIGAGKDVTSNFTQFVLQLLYALCFLEEDPKSPFVINPRSFPLRESLIFVDQLQQTVTANEMHAGVSILYKTLKEYILQHCPDLIQTKERYDWLDQKHESFVVPHQAHFVTPNMVHDAINDCFRQSTDPSGVRAEKLFYASRAANPSASVDIAAVSALLASRRSQPKFVSYVTLCKDPLLLLQARAAVWKCKGLRRIMIRVLCDLMSANESITRKDSASPMAALQYLTARDAVILKCVLFACASASLLRSNSENTSMHCAMCVSLMRSIASSRRGVIAILVKEGLPQNSTDFLAQFIPESFLDASELISLLSEMETIPLVERLATASAALSICAANSSRGEATAKNLLSASLDTLIDGFFLVIGPVGLPVSVFRDENNGQDITLMCKEATFQMIKTLSTINPRSSLKKDACLYLTKIAALCKSENAMGGVSGAVAAKRKNLLKEIYDSCDSSYRYCLGGSLS
jgi:hypothetical protein